MMVIQATLRKGVTKAENIRSSINLANSFIHLL